MKKSVRLLATVCVVLTGATMVAQADSKEPRRKKQTLFGMMFENQGGGQRARRKERNRLFDDNWWNEGSGGDPRIVNGQRYSKRRNSQVVSVDDDDTGDGDSGFGMGNITYVPPKLVALNGARLDVPRPFTDEAAGAVYDALTAAEPPIRVSVEIRDTLIAHYKAQDFRPVWIDNGAVSARAAAVLKLLSDADAEGLDAAGYLPSSLPGFTAPLPQGDIAELARLDLELSAAVLKYARDASGGQFDPRKLSLYNDITPPWVPAAKAMKVVAFSPYAAEYLAGLHPQHPAYAAMKQALADLRKAGSTVPADLIPDGDIVKQGKADPRILAIRGRLAALGYERALEPQTDDGELFDADLGVQVRLFQKAMGLKATGQIGPQTIAALNADTSARDTAKLLNNMERVRWMPRELGQRHVFVNQAAYQVRVMEGDTAVWSSRVIVGKPTTQTAVFNDEMETVVFNPSWGVPQSIIANEYLPKLRRDPSYLDRIGFKVVNESGKQVSSSSVDWWSYGNTVPYGVQQPPGTKNALGEVKFLFPNEHNIYMHDTPNRELFEKDARAFSHGCVRVQNPREFAAVILGWDPDTIDEKIDSKKSQTVKLPQKVPVHLAYFTAWPDDMGRIAYYSDLYGRDAAMDAARNMVVLAAR
jgi:L,D-transpeptidase YcbB